MGVFDNRYDSRFDNYLTTMIKIASHPLPSAIHTKKRKLRVIEIQNQRSTLRLLRGHYPSFHFHGQDDTESFSSSRETDTHTHIERSYKNQKSNTFSQYTRSRSFTTTSVSSDLVMSLEAQCGGGRSGAMLIAGMSFLPSTLIDATLKPFPHWLQILRPRHFSSNTSSRSLRLTTKSMFVTSSNIS